MEKKEALDLAKRGYNCPICEWRVTSSNILGDETSLLDGQLVHNNCLQISVLALDKYLPLIASGSTIIEAIRQVYYIE